MRYVVRVRSTSASLPGVGRSLGPLQASIQLSIQPSNGAEVLPPSQHMAISKVPAVYGHSESLAVPPSPSNSRSVLLGVALEETPLGLPNTDFSCPNGIVERHIELHSFFHSFSDLHISPDFYGLQDVENYGALLPSIGDLVWVRSLSFRFVSTRQVQQNTSCHFTHKEARQCPLQHRKSLHGLKSLYLREMSQSMRRPLVVAHGETLIRGTLPAGNLRFSALRILILRLFVSIS
jgi:hypothetical protein